MQTYSHIFTGGDEAIYGAGRRFVLKKTSGVVDIVFYDSKGQKQDMFVGVQSGAINLEYRFSKVIINSATAQTINFFIGEKTDFKMIIIDGEIQANEVIADTCVRRSLSVNGANSAQLTGNGNRKSIIISNFTDNLGALFVCTAGELTGEFGDKLYPGQSREYFTTGELRFYNEITTMGVIKYYGLEFIK